MGGYGAPGRGGPCLNVDEDQLRWKAANDHAWDGMGDERAYLHASLRLLDEARADVERERGRLAEFGQAIIDRDERHLDLVLRAEKAEAERDEYQSERHRLMRLISVRELEWDQDRTALSRVEAAKEASCEIQKKPKKEINMKVKVHTITAEAQGADGKAYAGTMAFGAESWANLQSEQHEHGREAAKVVAVRLADDMGVEVIGEPKIVGEADEEIEIEDPA